MPLLQPAEQQFLATLRELAYCNPFVPRRIELERRALGDEFTSAGADWNVHPEMVDNHPNLVAILSHCERLSERLHAALARGVRPSALEADLYEHLVLFRLYHQYAAAFDAIIARVARAEPSRRPIRVFDRFREQADTMLRLPGVRPIGEAELAHLFACFWQLRRAFHHIFRNIIGVSRPAARFRAAVWQSMFTHDMQRYRRVLYDRLADFTTLITGPSGTGKELAARAVGFSRYVPFDPRSRTFAADAAGAFYAVNLAALSPTLIESELFGHQRGSFTGAVADRVGWLETCPPLGTVFLDELGEVDAAIQLKLLRVLEARTFQRIGDTKDRRFHGKIIAATNRDLAAECRAGRFREDLYYRVCADMIAAPSLHERISDSPEELRHLILFIARRVVGEEAEQLADEVEAYAARHLGPGYAWPGNVRELEQCVRNVLIRQEYRPAERGSADGRRALAEAVVGGRLTAEELLNRYCGLVYTECGSYQETARRLGLDRRTVKARVAAVRAAD